MKTEIKPEELRIGNILNYDTGEGIFETTITWEDLKHISESPKEFNDYHSPIPLTEEKLIEMGFGLVSGVWTLENQWFEIEQLDKGLWFTTYGRDVELLHVHQLQNLYYALTQTELIN